MFDKALLRRQLCLFMMVQGAILLNSTDETYVNAWKIVNSNYDSMYPLIYYNSTTSLMPHHYGKRCQSTEVRQSINDYVSGKWKTALKGMQVLISSSCIASDSIGNYLANYFEIASCAQIAGLHFMTVAKTWEPKLNHASSPFINNLPSIIVNELPKESSLIKSNIISTCKCRQSCHSNSNAAWIQNIAKIKSIFYKAIAFHMKECNFNQTKVSPTDFCTEQPYSVLPFIPDVAIHYRCSDNFVRPYGFLPFSAITDRIPVGTVRTIYVLSEKRGRKTSVEKSHLIRKCDRILSELFRYLVTSYPMATVLIRRGGDLYEDMARLTFAKITICSVSTFCLWPAIASEGKAYFPKSALIASGQSNIKLGFHWITDPSIVYGSDYATLPVQHILSKLRDRTQIPSKS